MHQSGKIRSGLLLSFKILTLCIYAWFCWLMVKITWQYRYFESDVAFLRIKQEYVGMLHYRIVFFVHVFSAIFVLLAGFTQFSKSLRTKYPSVHRKLGKIYVYVTLFLAAPSGFAIGVYANGGIGSRIAFCMLAVLWWYFTFMAMRTAIKKKFLLHRDFMIRSFSLALSAITLRAWKFAIVYYFQPKPMDVYRIVAWLGWVLNLLIAELIIINLHKKYKNQKT
ncbi:MAG: DUF2306 domain-containing protein [Bacteroidia bacterium]|nr:DUF2306 domain-containing protein [Bacteroidia bacterium]